MAVAGLTLQYESKNQTAVAVKQDIEASVV
jgi:hypothetical protein